MPTAGWAQLLCLLVWKGSLFIKPKKLLQLALFLILFCLFTSLSLSWRTAAERTSTSVPLPEAASSSRSSCAKSFGSESRVSSFLPPLLFLWPLGQTLSEFVWPLFTASETGSDYHPIFFCQDRLMEELFCVCIQLLNKTWKEMRATQEDFDKVQ